MPGLGGLQIEMDVWNRAREIWRTAGQAQGAYHVPLSL